jgi:DNA-binding beta-propeller fold protein YncE
MTRYSWCLKGFKVIIALSFAVVLPNVTFADGLRTYVLNSNICTVDIFDTKTGTYLTTLNPTLPMPGRCTSIAASKSGKYLYLLNGGVVKVDAATGNVLASQYSVGISRRLVFSQDGRFLYGTSPFTAFDPDTLAVIATLPTLVGTRAAIDDTELVFTPDNTLACTWDFQTAFFGCVSTVTNELAYLVRRTDFNNGVTNILAQPVGMAFGRVGDDELQALRLEKLAARRRSARTKS